MHVTIERFFERHKLDTPSLVMKIYTDLARGRGAGSPNGPAVGERTRIPPSGNRCGTKPEQLAKYLLLRDSERVRTQCVRQGGSGMALSMDEQRILAEIERRLAADDPGLASCLSTFRRPGPGTVLRSPRARIIGSLFTVLLVAMVSLMIYAMIPFRTHLPRHPAQATTSAPGHTAVSVA